MPNEYCEPNQMNLGELISAVSEVLDVCESDTMVTFSDARYRPSEIMSVRGFYEDLAIGFATTRNGGVNIHDFYKLLTDVVGTVMTGYKGGNYKMTAKTPLWVANYGNTRGYRVSRDKYHMVVSGISYDGCRNTARILVGLSEG